MGAPNSFDEQFKNYRASHDPSDLAPIFEELAPRLKSAARRAGLDEPAAEELVQETFLGLIKAEPRFDEGRPFLPWVQGIALRQIRAEKRRHARIQMLLSHHSDVLDQQVFLDRDAGGGSMAREELRSRIKYGIGTLSEGNQEVVSAALLDGLSHAEIGERLGLSRSAVAVRLHRGIKQLRERLGGSGGLAAILTVPSEGTGLKAAPAAIVSRRLLIAAAALVIIPLGGWFVLRANVPPPVDVESAELEPPTPATEAGEDGLVAAGLPAAESGEEPSEGLDVPDVVPFPSAEDEGFSERSFSGRIVGLNGSVVPEGAQIFLLASDPVVVLPTAPLQPVAMTAPGGSYTLMGHDFRDDRTPILMARYESSVGWVDVTEDHLESGELPELELHPELSLQLTVTDPSGQRLEGARLSAWTQVPRFLRTDGATSDTFGFLPAEPYHYLFGAATDDQGKGTIRGLFGAESPGLIVCYTAKVPGYARATRAIRFPGGTSFEDTIELLRTEHLRLAGKVVDEGGAPIAGVRWSFDVRGGAPLTEGVGGATEASGAWSVPSQQLDEFPLQLRFSHRQFVTRTLLFEQPDELLASDYEIQMQPALTLRGSVKAAGGEPIPSAAITVTGAQTFQTVMTDANGAFEVHGLLDSLRSVTVRVDAVEGLRRRRSKVFSLAPDDLDVALTLEDSDSLGNLRVELDDGSPWGEAVLLAVDVRGFDGWLSVHELSGSMASFMDVPPGSWTFMGTTPEGGQVLQAIELEGGETDHSQAVGLTVPGRLELVVATEGGSLGEGAKLEPGSPCVVVARRIGLDVAPNWFRVNGRSPRFELKRATTLGEPIRFTNLIPGRWQLSARGEGWTSGLFEAEVRAGEATRVDLWPEASSELIVALPGFRRAGLLRFDVRAGSDEEWHTVALRSLGYDYACEEKVKVSAGRWQWRARVEYLTAERAFASLFPPTYGVVEAKAGGAVSISLTAGSLQPVE